MPGCCGCQAVAAAMLLRLMVNSGLAAARNRGIAGAKDGWIAPFNADGNRFAEDFMLYVRYLTNGAR